MGARHLALALAAAATLAPSRASAQYSIVWYDDYEESSYPGSLREYLEAQGHTVDYHSDGVSLDLSDPSFDGFDVVVAEHTCGTGTLLGLEEWLTSGRGYVALLAGSMYNDPDDTYIRTLLDVDTNGCPVGSPWGSTYAWEVADLEWVDAAHAIATTPNRGFLPSEIEWDQSRYHVDLPGGEPVIRDSSTTAVALVVAETVLGGASGNVAFLGTNYHGAKRSDAETRMLVENIIAWVVEGGDADEDGFTRVEGDCDDHDPDVFPGATETCDGRDNDCDGDYDEGFARTTHYADRDADGHGDDATPIEACTDGPYISPTGGDCNDDRADCYPGATELCDGLDNDCDGDVDDGLTFVTWYRDDDGDGYGLDASETTTCEDMPGWVTTPGDCDDRCFTCTPVGTEVCDYHDNDCDGDVDEGLSVTLYWDGDGDGYGNPASERVECDVLEGYIEIGDDCFDADPATYPGAEELCDGRDNDCDGEIDEGLAGESWYRDGDGDGYGDEGDVVEACHPPTGYVAEGGDCDDDDPEIHPGAEEALDGVDNDCDGEVDEPDAPDGDGDADGDVDGDADGDVDGDVDGDADGDADGDDEPDGATPGSCDCSAAAPRSRATRLLAALTSLL